MKTKYINDNNNKDDDDDDDNNNNDNNIPRGHLPLNWAAADGWYSAFRD